jgi:hypothetical protein
MKDKEAIESCLDLGGGCMKARMLAYELWMDAGRRRNKDTIEAFEAVRKLSLKAGWRINGGSMEAEGGKMYGGYMEDVWSWKAAGRRLYGV